MYSFSTLSACKWKTLIWHPVPATCCHTQCLIQTWAASAHKYELHKGHNYFGGAHKSNPICQLTNLSRAWDVNQTDANTKRKPVIFSTALQLFPQGMYHPQEHGIGAVLMDPSILTRHRGSSFHSSPLTHWGPDLIPSLPKLPWAELGKSQI